jgi:hypothetical protein
MGLIVAMAEASLVFGQNWLHSPEFGLGALYGVFSAIFYGAYHLASQKGRLYLDTLSYF